MAANAYFPEDWAAMLQFVVDWARDNTPSYVRAIHAKAVRQGSGVPAPPKPYAWVHVMVPPVDEGRGDDNARLYPGACLTVESVGAGDYTATVAGQTVTFTAGPTDTEETIVDGLLALLDALTSTDTVHAKQAITVGQYGHVLTIQGATTPATLPTITFSSNLLLQRVRATENEAIATIGIDIIGRNEPEAETTEPGPIAESVTFVYMLQSSLQDIAVQEAFCAAGWAIVSVEGMRKPDQIFNGAWEDRSGFDLRLRCRTRILRVGDYIETIAPGAFAGSLS